MNLVGCKHNLERTLQYPKPAEWVKWRKETFEVGQSITLVCPKGCQDVYVHIRSQGNK